MGPVSAAGLLIRAPVARGQKQICDVLHVDLEEADRDSEHGLVRVLLNVVKDVLDGPRHDANLVLDVGTAGSPRALATIFARSVA